MESEDLEDYEEVFELTQDTFGWIGIRLLDVARNSQAPEISQIAGEVFALGTEVASASSSLGPKLEKIVDLIERQCAVSH